MESFTTLKRRTTEVFENAQQNMPNMPTMSSVQRMASTKLPNMPTMASVQRMASTAKLPSMPKMPRTNSSGQVGPKGTWERIDVPSVPRSSHSLDVVLGSAYIFGGEMEARQPVDNDMHVVRLPISGLGGDYYKIKAVAAQPDEQAEEPIKPASEEVAQSGEGGLDEVPLQTQDKGKGKQVATDDKPALGDVPQPRVGHATAVIGTRIFMFGGRGGPEMQPLEESGRVWIFDTRARAWSYLDPVPAVVGGAIVPHPAARSYHCATSTDRPRDFVQPRPRRAESWKEWALGDTSRTGIPQDPIVGNIAEDAVDEETRGYGTFIVHGGCLASGERTNDMWAFNVRNKTWTELPAAPGPARGGTAICISKSRLYRFGGFDGKVEIGGQLDFLHLEVEMFDDKSSRGEVAIHAKGGWQSIIQNNMDASSPEIPAVPSQTWPTPRSVASFNALNLGGGREVLVLSMGESDPSTEGHAGAGKFLGDVWTFQVPPLGMSAASLTDAVLQAMGRKTGEGQWNKLTMGPFDDEKDDGAPVQRGWVASAPTGDLDESGIVMWGGLGEDNKRLGDGWILRVE